METQKQKLRVGILGCTGLVGQRLIEQLSAHPNFKIERLFGRPERKGEVYYDIVNWSCETSLPKQIAEMAITSIEDEKTFSEIDIFLSALPASAAEQIESNLRSKGKVVVSNAKSHRMDSDVPLLIPEINVTALALVTEQKKKYSGGFIATNPNCSSIGISLALAPIEKALGIEKLHIATLQARSGAGIKGLTSTEMTANVIPNIDGEEAKIKQEIPKIFGRTIPIKVRVNRVPVADGHTFNIWVTTKKKATVGELKELWKNFKPECGPLYSISKVSSIYNIYDDEFMPQPKQDAWFLNGMGTSIGRVEAISDNEFCLTAVSNNIVRGAAGGTLLIAEALLERGMI
jgi:aspartate-semialdehyde dehydrogenase